MKPLVADVRTKTNITGPARAMAIDTDALAHIMGVLTNLYTDPIAAVVREYSTNALDAAREAGSSEPIRVTTPTAMAPHFVVEDYGIGMSTDTILDHYSLYGRSDKRDSNEVVGMLGLGCKSALTYADTFTITSRRDGVETVAIVAKNDQGVGEIQIADTRKTDKRNGTTVTVPVHSYDVHRFTAAADEFYSFWDAGTVLVNGRAPRSVFADGFVNIPGTPVWQKREWGEHIVLMGNVPYKVNSEILREFRGTRLIIKAPIGSVSFAPSREELFYNNTTNKFLRDTIQAVATAIQTEVSGVLNSAKTGAEAFLARQKFGHYNFMNNINWTWNGKTVPDVIRNTADESIHWSQNGYNSKARFSWRLYDCSSTLFIKGYKGKSIPAYIKEGLETLSGDDKHVAFGMTDYVFIRDGYQPPYLEWIDPVEWSAISADIPKPNKVAGGTGVRVMRSGKEIDNSGYLMNPITANDKDKYILLAPSEFTEGSNSPNNSGLTFATIRAAGFIPVLVYVREQAAWREEYTVGTLADVKAWVKDQQDNIPDSWYDKYALDRAYSWLRGKAIDDPNVAVYTGMGKATALPAGVMMDSAKFDQALGRLNKAMEPYNDFVGTYLYGGRQSATWVEVMNALYAYRNRKDV